LIPPARVDDVEVLTLEELAARSRNLDESPHNDLDGIDNGVVIECVMFYSFYLIAPVPLNSSSGPVVQLQSDSALTDGA
jgi:hypothetical protein